MAGPTGVITYNHDVAGLQRRINRFIYEMIKSVSNAGSLMNDYDKNRLSTYLTAIRAYVGWVVSQPQLDLPETSPRAITLDPNPSWEMMENEAIIDVIRMLEIARDELVNSQASRASSGLNKFDEARILALVTKVEDFLTKYINVITPLDLPESTPMRAMTGAGQTGV